MAERFLGQRRYTSCVKDGSDPWEHEVMSLVSLRDVLVRKDMSYVQSLERLEVDLTAKLSLEYLLSVLILGCQS